MTNNLKAIFGRATHATEQRGWLLGRLGRLAADGVTWVFKLGYRQDRVWVRMGANGDQGIYAAYNKGGVPLRGDLPVRMRLDNGVLTIYEEDGALLGADPNAPATPSGVPLHHHRSVAGSPLAPNPLSFELEAKQFERGRVRSAGGMLVNIAAFGYMYNGVWETWPGGDLDLTAYKPATAGHHAWVMVGVNPATNTAVAVTGASVVYATALAYADLDALKNAVTWARNACAAIDVRDDDTALTDITDYMDAHGWFGQGTTVFTELSDTPADYTGDAGKIVQVNSTADALEFRELGLKFMDAADKATPVDGDWFPLADSAASYGLAAVSWQNIKATLKAYFDTLYATVGGWVKADGTVPLTAAWDIGATRRILQEAVRARDDNGVKIEDNAGNVRVAALESGTAVNTGTLIGEYHVQAVDKTFTSHVALIHPNPIGVDEVSILADGTVAEGLHVNYVLTNETSGDTVSGDNGLEPSGTFSVVVGTGTYQFEVTATGEFTAVRTAGAGAVQASLWLHWR